LILIVFLAATFVLAGQLTVGMVFAFMAYRQHFTERSVALVEKALEFRILGLHLERLSDIALTPVEKGHAHPLSYIREIEGGLELRNVFFRYSETEPFVLENINLKVEPGEFVTVTGPSGGGKTTLIKLMLGLLEPTSGEVLVDGLPLSTIGVRAFREQVAAVMQEDQLLSGSIADNISFFDQQFDDERLLRCAKLAAIHAEIMAMPMTYNSLIGDMGSSRREARSSGFCSPARSTGTREFFFSMREPLTSTSRPSGSFPRTCGDWTSRGSASPTVPISPAALTGSFVSRAPLRP
jgi:ATP-binding cassette subfamily B protein RaxB